jgi:hypothetical protein
VEFDVHSIGLFHEHFQKTLVNELVDLPRHGLALADGAHWWVFRSTEKISMKVTD